MTGGNIFGRFGKALLRCLVERRVGSPSVLGWSDHRSEFVERCRDSKTRVQGVDAEFVVTAAQVLDEGVTTDHHRRRRVAFESPHGPQSRLEPERAEYSSGVISARCCGLSRRCCGFPGALKWGAGLALGQAAGWYWLMSPAQVVVRSIRWFGRIGVTLSVSLGARWPIPRWGLCVL